MRTWPPQTVQCCLSENPILLKPASLHFHSVLGPESEATNQRAGMAAAGFAMTIALHGRLAMYLDLHRTAEASAIVNSCCRCISVRRHVFSPISSRLTYGLWHKATNQTYELGDAMRLWRRMSAVGGKLPLARYKLAPSLRGAIPPQGENAWRRQPKHTTTSPGP